MDASDDFEVFETRSEPAPEGVDVVDCRPVGSQGMAQTSVTDTDTAGTAGCEVHADAYNCTALGDVARMSAKFLLFRRG